MSTFGYPQGHALIVAIASYRHIKPLPDVVLNDARDVAAMLGSPQHCGYDPGNVKQLLNDAATRTAVLAALCDLAARAGTDDTACLYFSGHGALIGGVDADESCLLTVDSRIGDHSSFVGAAELSGALQQIRSKRLIVFLDACHAAGAGSLKSATIVDHLGFSEKTLSRLVQGAGRTLMASSRASETSLIMPGARNSAFTQALLDGLGGAADRLGAGTIKVFDLFEYVADRVPTITGDAQHPIFKASQLEQNFTVSLSRGGTKASRPASAIGPAASDAMHSLQAVLPVLYPTGPGDQEIWERAGGDVSRIRLQGTGRGAWFAALKTLEMGGGGAGINFDSLINAALSDYPNHPDLLKLRHP